MLASSRQQEAEEDSEDAHCTGSRIESALLELAIKIVKATKPDRTTGRSLREKPRRGGVWLAWQDREANTST